MKINSSIRSKLEQWFRNKDGFCIQRLEEIEINTISNQPYTSKVHQLIFVTAGTLTHRIDGIERTISNSEMCALEQGHIHEYVQATKLKGFFIRYTNDFIPSGGASYKTTFYACLKGHLGDENYQVTLSNPEIERCVVILEELKLEFATLGDFTVNKGIIQHLLIALVLILERRARSMNTERVGNTKGSEKEIYHDFMEMLEKKYVEEHNMTYYSQELGVSRRKLTEILKRFHRKTAKRMHVERIMLEAKRLLAYSNLSLKQIAYQLGFEHAPYFSNKFKDEFGFTPNQFRIEKQASINR